MKEINEKLEKLKSRSCTKSIRDDLKKKGDMIFSEESSRAVYEMGNMELIDLRQSSATIQSRGVEHLSIRRLATTHRTATVTSRGKISGHNPWLHNNHQKAMNSKR